MTEDTIDGQLLDLMLRAGSRWVLWLLLGLSVAAVAIIVERIWFFLQERSPKEHLANALAALRESGPTAAAAKLAGMRSMEATVARVCLNHARDGAAAVEEQKAATLELERVRYEKRLAFLGTLGNNAPFIGLFGTVLGIIKAFADLSKNQGGGAAVVMAGIAEALVATAVGLLVALPAVVAHNIFQGRIRRTMGRVDAIAHIILTGARDEARKDAGKEG